MYVFFRPSETVDITGPTLCPSVGSQNWQPPAPIYPHLEQVCHGVYNLILAMDLNSLPAFYKL